MKKIANLENLIYLTVFCLPLYLVRFNLLGVPTNVLEMLIGTSFVFWILNRVETRQCLVSTGAIDKKYLLPILLIFAGLIISRYINMYVSNYVHSLGIIKGWFVLPFLFFVAARSVVPNDKIKNIFIAYYLSAFVVALVSLGFYFSGNVTFDGRLQGIFNSPNYLAMYLAPALITALAKFSILRLRSGQAFNFQFSNNSKFLNDQDSKYKTFLAVSVILILIIFYFTYSYAAWTALFGSLVIGGLIKMCHSERSACLPARQVAESRDLAACKEKKVLWKIFGKKINKKYALLVVIFLLTLLFQLSNKKFTDIINLDERSSLASRVMIWKSAGKMLEEHWLWGVGSGNFQEIYLEYQKYFPPYLEWAAPHPHNIFLAFWLAGGIFCLVGFLWLIFLYFSDVLRRIGISKTSIRMSDIRNVGLRAMSEQITYISLAIMLYILLHGLVDTTYFKNDLAVVFWMCFLVL